MKVFQYIGGVVLILGLCLSANTSESKYPNEEYKVADYFPLGPEHSYKMVMSYDSYSYSEWCMTFSNVGEDGICECTERRGCLSAVTYFKKGNKGIYRSANKETLLKNEASLFLPTKAKVKESWLYKEDGHTFKMSLVGRLGAISRNFNEFLIIRSKLESPPSDQTIEYLITKRVGTIAIKVISGSSSCPKLGMAFRNEYLYDEKSYEILP